MQPEVEHCIAPYGVAERRELAEVRGPLDGAAFETELLRGGVIVNRGVAIVVLHRQHLFWSRQGSRKYALLFR